MSDISSMTYDDSQLQRLFGELEEKRRVQALKGGFRRAANEVRKMAVNNLRRTGICNTGSLEKGIRALVFKRRAGFRVTVGTKRKSKAAVAKMSAEQKAREKKYVSLIWLEDGTAERYTKTGTKIRTRSRRGHYTGRVKRYGFMLRTKGEAERKVTDEIHKDVREYIVKTAKKYGCKA